jgi:beta-lactamase class A
MAKNPVSRRELMGLGALAASGLASPDLFAADTVATPAGLEQAIKQLEQTWNGSFSIAARRLDAPGKFLRRPESVLPTASVCKLFVLCELFRQAEAGLIDLNAPVTWKPEHHRGGDGVLRAMVPGQALSAHNMAVLMIVLSDNIATAALADLVGATNVERSLTTWQLGDSHFYAGLPAGPKANEMRQPVSSPRDLDSLITRIYRHEILTPKSCDEIIRILRAQRCNDMLPRFIPVGEDWGQANTWIANKTGYGECRVEVGIVKAATATFSLAMFFKPHKAPPHRLKSISDYPPVLAMAHACLAVYNHFAAA